MVSFSRPVAEWLKDYEEPKTGYGALLLLRSDARRRRIHFRCSSNLFRANFVHTREIGSWKRKKEGV
jgi:hypothetical protein